MNMRRKDILHRLLFKIHEHHHSPLKIQYGHHHLQPASQVAHKPHQLISQETLAEWNS